MGEQRAEPPSARGAPGARDTGAGTAAGGTADREPGDTGHEETTSTHGTDAEREAEFTSAPSSGAGPATPPDEGRQQAADAPDETATGKVYHADAVGAVRRGGVSRRPQC